MSSDEWYTPSEIIEPIREFYGVIDYDPCSCIKANETIKASTFNSIDDDFTSSAWKGNIWVNPPYCNNQTKVWLSRARQQYRSSDSLINQIIVLVNRSDAKYYYEFLDNHDDGYYQFRNRIKFTDGVTGERSQPRYNNDLIYFGKDILGFKWMCINSFGKPVPASK